MIDAIVHAIQDLDFNNFWLIISKPDNVPVLGLYPLLAFFTGWGIVQGMENDRRKRAGLPLIEQSGEKTHTWPYLTRLEFLALIIVMVIMTVWSVALDAPLEEPADPSTTPNPSKAPWYFLGLQEMLVYFDPWFAGVVLPGLIVMGLIAIPYVDSNEAGSGYYTVRERPFAIAVFFFGFFVLWCAQIFIGTFLRGPGWNFFGLFETWDPHKIVPLNNVDMSNLIGSWVSGLMDALNMEGGVAVAAHFDAQKPLGILIGAAAVMGYLGLAPMSYLYGRRVLRRREIVDPETNRVRDGSPLLTVDWIAGTDPERVTLAGMVLDLFIWSIKLPAMIFLGVLRFPSLGAAGFVLCLLLLGAYAAFMFSMATAVTAALLLWLLLHLRRPENWERWRAAVMEKIPGWIVSKVADLGLLRFFIVSNLFLIMLGVPIKMVLRWTLAVKYIWVLPGVFNI